MNDTPMSSTAVTLRDPLNGPDRAEVAAAGFLVRYANRTLDAYRYDLRVYFQWAANNNIKILAATRAHIELYRATLEGRGLAGTTVGRRLSTVCSFYRFAHIDGHIAANPAQYVQRLRIQPPEGRGLDRGELAQFLFAAERVDHLHVALAMLLGLNGLRVSEACGTDIEGLGVERGHRTLRIMDKGSKPATIPLVPRTARTIDLAIGERTSGPILVRSHGARLDRRGAYRWVRSIGHRAGLARVFAQDPWPGLACRAEEFALNAVLTQIRIEADTDENPIRDLDQTLAQVTDAAFDDIDFLFAFDPAADGIDDPDTDAGRFMGIGSLHPRHWFDPFNDRRPHPLVHP